MKRKKPPVSAIIGLIISFAVILTYVASRLSVAVADAVNSTVSSVYRQFMASLTSNLPFSLFEIVIYSLPLAVTLVVIFACRAFRQGRGGRYLVKLTSTVLLVLSGHLLALGGGSKAR